MWLAFSFTIFGKQFVVGNHVETQLCGEDLGFVSPGAIKLVQDRDFGGCGVIWSWLHERGLGQWCEYRVNGM